MCQACTDEAERLRGLSDDDLIEDSLAHSRAERERPVDNGPVQDFPPPDEYSSQGMRRLAGVLVVGEVVACGIVGAMLGRRLAELLIKIALRDA